MGVYLNEERWKLKVESWEISDERGRKSEVLKFWGVEVLLAECAKLQSHHGSQESLEGVICGNDKVVYPDVSLHEVIIWNSAMLLIQGAKTMLIIVFSMILIVATMIYIVFAKIDNVLKCLKYVWGICYIIANLLVGT